MQGVEFCSGKLLTNFNHILRDSLDGSGGEATVTDIAIYDIIYRVIWNVFETKKRGVP